MEIWLNTNYLTNIENMAWNVILLQWKQYNIKQNINMVFAKQVDEDWFS